MKATDTLVLPRDVVIVPATAFGATLREQMGAADRDLVMTRPRSRARSVVLDAEAAAFLDQFRSPSTVIEAVMRHAGVTGVAPEQLLETAAPLLVRLRQQRLVVLDGDAAALIEPTLAPGAIVEGLTIGSCVHLFEDVEVYRCRAEGGNEVALKILRPGPTADSLAMVQREAAMLEYLEGCLAPALLAVGEVDGRPYLVQEWCVGRPCTRVAAARRAHARSSYPSDLLGLCVAILRAYSALHARGVVHADVHPGNVRIDPEGRVTLLDFGLSPCDALDSRLPAPRRGGLPEYFEPEYCAALLRHQAPPAATRMSDQYAIGSLLYAMLTGLPCQEFSLQRDTWLRQVADGRPASFASRGQPECPELEAVLRRALDIDPTRRFATIDQLLDAFATAATNQPQSRRSSTLGPSFLAEVLARFTPAYSSTGGGEAIQHLSEPTCSVTYGAGGIAFFLYRLASLRGDARLLSAADVWCTRALSQAHDPAAFVSEEIGITTATTGAISPFHAVSGLHLVRTLIARAMGDRFSAAAAARAFVHAGSTFSPNPDCTLGWSSVLLGCACLAEALWGLPDARQPVMEEGTRLASAATDWMMQRTIAGAQDVRWVGVAHGWAGILFALLRWTEATGAPLPSVARERLDELAMLAREDGGEISWPVQVGDTLNDAAPFTGWCHGSAGHVLLWLLANRIVGDPHYLALARGAANHVAAAGGSARSINGSLCCGFAGQGYAMLSLHRQTGDAGALDLARSFGACAIDLAAGSSRRDSLFKGDVGIALLIEELEHPPFASFPLVETEAWPH